MAEFGIAALTVAGQLPHGMASIIDVFRKLFIRNDLIKIASRDLVTVRIEALSVTEEVERVVAAEKQLDDSSYRSRLESLYRQIMALPEEIADIETSVKRKRHYYFPSLAAAKILQTRKKISELSHLLQELRYRIDDDRRRSEESRVKQTAPTEKVSNNSLNCSRPHTTDCQTQSAPGDIANIEPNMKNEQERCPACLSAEAGFQESKTISELSDMLEELKNQLEEDRRRAEESRVEQLAANEKMAEGFLSDVSGSNSMEYQAQPQPANPAIVEKSMKKEVHHCTPCLAAWEGSQTSRKVSELSDMLNELKARIDDDRRKAAESQNEIKFDERSKRAEMDVHPDLPERTGSTSGFRGAPESQPALTFKKAPSFDPLGISRGLFKIATIIDSNGGHHVGRGSYPTYAFAPAKAPQLGDGHDRPGYLVKSKQRKAKKNQRLLTAPDMPEEHYPRGGFFWSAKLKIMRAFQKLL